MTLLLKQIFAFIKLLNSDTGTNQIASGVACGIILGLAPALSLQTLLVFGVAFVFRIQLGATFLTAFFVKFGAYLADPYFHVLGSWALELASLKPIFTEMYNMPIVPFTRFNNSITMGSAIASILLAPFSFLFARFLVQNYRVQILARFQSTQFWKIVKSTAFYKWYAKYDELYGQQ